MGLTLGDTLDAVYHVPVHFEYLRRELSRIAPVLGAHL